MNLQSLVGAFAAPTAGHADWLAYQAAYLLSSGVEVFAVAIVVLFLFQRAGLGLWRGVAGRIVSGGVDAIDPTPRAVSRERA